MPAITNPSRSFSATFKDEVSSVLVEYAFDITRNETPISPNNTGYLGYRKRINFANKLITNRHDKDLEGTILSACQFIFDMQPDILLQDQIFRFLVIDNPSGTNAFSNAYTGFSNGFQGQVQPSEQIFSILAGCTQEDFI
jgi:hypothetical protein